MTVEQVGIEVSYRQLRRWGRRVLDTFFCSCDSRLLPFGKECIWNVRPDMLTSESIVLSAGVGKDISFEKELIDYVGCNVVLADPSPTGLRTMSLPENQRPQLEFLPVGLGGHDGFLELQVPADESEGSYWSDSRKSAAQGVRFPCRSLSSLAKERGWNRIDLLKLDIEASEYDVIADLAQSGLKVGQLCVEFHHFMPSVPFARTLRAIETLHRSGFRFAHKAGSDFTFLSTM